MHTFDDVNGCKKGDDIVFMPHQWGNEQLPVEFAGCFCDFSKSIALTKGGVACVYKGPAERIQGKDAGYSALYSSVRKNPTGWHPDGNAFIRIKSRAKQRQPIKVGDSAKEFLQKCLHDLDGNEMLEKFQLNRSGEIAADLYAVILNANYGDVIEVVKPNAHYFLSYEAAAPKK